MIKYGESKEEITIHLQAYMTQEYREKGYQIQVQTHHIKKEFLLS